MAEHSLPISTIGYVLKRGEFVTLKIYTIYGEEVSILVSGFKASGEYEVTFNGEHLNAGIYFYTLKAGGFMETRRMVLYR